jgi:hypothetical protein
MSGELQKGPAIFSRRSLLWSTAAAAGIVCVGPNLARAQPKISKVAVNYQEHPDGDKRCDKCIQFLPPDACKMVEGMISPQGSCRIFMPRPSST